jgi:hypothetical protein
MAPYVELARLRLRASMAEERERLADTETSKTSNIVAYDCVLRGREFMLGKEKNLETLGQAIKYFKQALEHPIEEFRTLGQFAMSLCLL